MSLFPQPSTRRATTREDTLTPAVVNVQVFASISWLLRSSRRFPGAPNAFAPPIERLAGTFPPAPFLANEPHPHVWNADAGATRRFAAPHEAPRILPVPALNALEPPPAPRMQTIPLPPIAMQGAPQYAREDQGHFPLPFQQMAQAPHVPFMDAPPPVHRRVIPLPDVPDVVLRRRRRVRFSNEQTGACYTYL